MDIRYNSLWEVMTNDFSIGIGSHSQNPNSTSLHIPKGTIIKWDDDSQSGNVWFYAEINGTTYRGKRESGNILNLIRNGVIRFHADTNGMIAYKL